MFKVGLSLISVIFALFRVNAINLKFCILYFFPFRNAVFVFFISFNKFRIEYIYVVYIIYVIEYHVSKTVFISSWSLDCIKR